MTQIGIGEPEHRLLRELAAKISDRLEATFTGTPGPDGTSFAIELVERGRRTALEMPATLLLQAREAVTARESVRIRIKAARDRMLFRPPPRPLPKNITSAADPALMGPGRFGRQQSRGRR